MSHQITIEQCIGEHKVCIATAANRDHVKYLYVCTILRAMTDGTRYIPTDSVVGFEVNINGAKTRHNYLQEAVDKYNSIP